MKQPYNSDAWNKRTAFSEIRAKYFAKPGSVTEKELYAAADAYIAALVEFKRIRKPKRFSIPNRTQLIRTPF